MSARPRAPRTRAALAATSTALLALLGTSLIGPAQTAVARDGAATAHLLQVADPADATRVVDVGGGERVAISPVGEQGASVVTALPDPDGASRA